MQASQDIKQLLQLVKIINYKNMKLHQNIKNATNKIAPFWPLKNLIACNPLQGFEEMHFNKALHEGFSYFKNDNLPKQMAEVNRITIKWCQVFFDEGQAAIKMPKKDLGFYKSFKILAAHDDELHKNNFKINEVSEDAESAIAHCLNFLEVKESDEEKFLTIMLTSLAGWASYIKYLADWSGEEKYKNIFSEYLAIRLVITCAVWKNAKELINLHDENAKKINIDAVVNAIAQNEKNYQSQLIASLKNQNDFKNENKKPDAQLVFCIDVRSEQFRRALEMQGNYETFGFAGFFGISARIENELSGETRDSLPVLLAAKHHVKEKSCNAHNHKKEVKGYQQINQIKNLYQSLKYNFTTPIALAEGIGLFSGSWMAVRTFSPAGSKQIKNAFLKLMNQEKANFVDISSISLEDQINYAKGALKLFGLTKNFADVVVFCGHGSETQNNSYESALDCGACGGRHGGANAQILAEILNQENVREALRDDKILIPTSTKFVAALHNTTSDEVVLYLKNDEKEKYKKLIHDLNEARVMNNYSRALKMGFKGDKNEAQKFIAKKTVNWSETRPEWGLAKNAAFIVAPRNLTKNINLDGRSFLHSYDYKQDESGSALEVILTAPMVVAEWINSQYLFSTIDNVAFGSGSKVTQNITGKIGIMQGNGSDLMHGLPLQSINSSDEKNYHEALRLSTFVYAPKDMVKKIVDKNDVLKKLFGNAWVNLFCVDPSDGGVYKLSEGLEWDLV